MFSVVIPTTRHATIDVAIASVEAQGMDVELLVEPDPERTGPAATRNRAIARATRPYLAFLDDDDVWLPGRLGTALAAHERGADLVVAYRRPVTPENVLDNVIPHLGETTIRRECAPPFNERYRGAEDAEWLLRVARSGASFATVPLGGFVYSTPDVREDHLERIAGSRYLLDDHADWFRSHPRAAAYRWERYGRMQLTVGEIAEARYALRRALRRRSAWKPYLRALIS